MKKNEEAMSCEELRMLAMDAERGGQALSEAQRAAWEAHLSRCASCAAHQETQLELRSRLRELAAETASAGTPLRVEARLRREVAALGQPQKWAWNRRGLAVLAAAAVLLVAVAIRLWTGPATPVANVPPPPAITTAPELPDAADLAAANATAAGDFVLLPGGFPDLGDDSAILRVRMQRAALGALGLPVNEEASAEWVMVDLLVSADGQPQAVRLLR